MCSFANCRDSWSGKEYPENMRAILNVIAGAHEGKLDVNPGWHSDSDRITNPRT